MDPDAYKYVLVASVAGGCAGALVMWNRHRSQVVGQTWLRRIIVLAVGTATSACALVAFTKAFGNYPNIHAAIVMVLMTGWMAILQSAIPLPVPSFVLSVRAGEFAILLAPWTGVRLFGALLRSTPLRHLGGRVYLSKAGGDSLTVLRSLEDAEAVHLWALLVCCPWFVSWAMQGMWMSIVCGLAVHVPLNIYPTLHVRYVTWRIERYMGRTQRSEAACGRS